MNPLSPLPTLSDIREAAKNFPSDIVQKTPLVRHHRLSEIFKANIYIKNEGLQSIGSYKIRGAINAVRKRNAVSYVAASAGNHSQGVSLACRLYKKKAIIFMPRITPPQKVNATRMHGGRYVSIQLVGDTFDEANEAARDFAKKTGGNFIHPFNDADIIAGQGTVGLEIIEQMESIGQPVDYLLVPVGGGGLLAGSIIAMKECSPLTEVIGIEPDLAAGMYQSLLEQKVTTLSKMSTFVDGAAVRTPGILPFTIAQQHKIKIVRIPEDRLCGTILDLFHFDKIVTEPAGALAIDALTNMAENIIGKTVVCILSGSNIDTRRFPEIIKKSDHYRRSRRYFTIELPNRPDALYELCKSIKGKGVNIRHFHYEEGALGGIATVLLGLESESQDKLAYAIEQLEIDHRMKEETENDLLAKIIEHQ